METENTNVVRERVGEDAAVLLAKRIRELHDGQTVKQRLAVDDRVLARVTDGIYRQPASALRELISNAYDADARSVIIQTDAPRFDRITIRDDGNGMTPEVLADLVCHIGGSSKRTKKGSRLGTARPNDSSRSPGGRKLIGKIGIGLFAVAQLTQHFQIITKRKGDNFRTSAVVVLKTYTEEQLANADDESVHFEPGDVTITTEPASELDAHGTEIILMNVRKATKDLLCSLDRWLALDEQKQQIAEEKGASDGLLGAVTKPLYHIGRVNPENRNEFKERPCLPWDEADGQDDRFKKFYEAVLGAVGKTVGNPTLASVFDGYLSMLWDLAVACPVRYLDGHPFSVNSSSGLQIFALSNEKRIQAQELEIPEDSDIATTMKMESCASDPVGGFDLNIDGVALSHPIVLDRELRSEKETRHTAPLLFAGKCISPFSKVEATLGGGALEFEAYFYWNTLIVPKENNGLLIRINGASGTLFDESFLDYRVSELTRLKQIMAEVYVTKGLDPALNIDRESFNTSHPHYQFIKDWVHRALRQVTNRLKAINKSLLDDARSEKAQRQMGRLDNYVSDVWVEQRGAGDLPPKVSIVATDSQRELELDSQRSRGVIVIDQAAIVSPLKKPPANASVMLDAKIRGLVVVLSAYGLLEGMPVDRVQSLVRDISAVFEGE
ncbi:ATP-binding protein [Burkholderia ubonensis]|uniref:ATP-binding protein n=1 Tax=Burkholderia ubonensis TaxID=101571 RepID=UPI000AFA6E70|nr:ATP-binding protein [Burkholderia ubonensis]